MEKLPLYSTDLIEELDKIYPLRMPNIEMKDREIWIRVGQRGLVEMLLAAVKEQEEQELPDIIIKE